MDLRLAFPPLLLGAAAAAWAVAPGGGEGPAERRAAELRIGALGCVACHPAPEAARERFQPIAPPDLARVGARLAPAALRRTLESPHGVSPAGTMPDCLAGLDGAARDAAAEDLTHYLVSLGGPIANPMIGIRDVRVESGRRLYHQIGCVACHEPFDAGSRPESSVPFGDLAEKTTIPALAAFLQDPLRAHPGGAMPAMGLTAAEAFDLAAYLLRGQRLASSAPGEAAPTADAPGLEYSLYRGWWKDLPDFSKLTPEESGIVERLQIPPKNPGDGFGVVFRGFLDVEKEGRYDFCLYSDDGARLFLDGRVVAEVDGVHPTAEKRFSLKLSAGRHPLEAQYFERDGGEDLGLALQRGPKTREDLPASWFSYAAPAYRLETEAFELDAARAAAGRKRFVEMRCVSCHPVAGLGAPPAAKRLDALDPSAPRSCLAEAPSAGLPNYRLDAPERAEIAAALARRGELGAPLPAEEKVARVVTRFRCTSCHAREGAGAPSEERLSWFTTLGEAELGDEGRIPPPLTGVGGKLTEEWLSKVLLERGAVRPYMAARMPQFGKASVGVLAGWLRDADLAGKEAPAAPFTEELAQAGRTLTGAGKFACVACHKFAGRDSLGVPAMDLASTTGRLRPEWFRRYLRDPASLRPGTRMPRYFHDGASPIEAILGGDAEKQIDALWAYLSLGFSAPLPTGLASAPEMELEPIDRPIVQRAFLTGIGPRGIAVGFPERVHFAFDAASSCLVKLWRGRFLSAEPSWQGRGGRFAEALGSDPVELPDPPLLTTLAPSNGDGESHEKPPLPAPRWRGYRLDPRGIPTFLYSVGAFDVEETVLPKIRPGGAVLERRWRVTGKEAPAGLALRLLEAPEIRASGDGTLFTPSGRQPSARVAPDAGAALRSRGTRKELLLPLAVEARGAAGFTARAEVELSW